MTATAPVQVMVVEDSLTQAFKYRLLLEEEGWEVSVVDSGEAALKELSRSQPALILADYHLPGITGEEFCRQVRANPAWRGMRILMLTADAAAARAQLSGADHCIAKSEPDSQLLALIRGLLRGPQAGFEVRHARILAIDDSPTYLAHVTSQLRHQGYHVESAANGPLGLDVLEQQDFDCVLVDLEMPEMDGIEVCRRVVSTRHRMDNPVAVIIVTTSASTEDMTRGLDSGADDFVSKSHDLSILRARIQSLMRRRYFQDENRRIIEELKTKEIATLQAQAMQAEAEVKAALAGQLMQANKNLEAMNRRLKETQAQLIQTEKMASLGQLVAGIAHEINNPMAFVLNNLFTVEELMDRIAPEAEPHLSPVSKQKLDKIRRRLNEMNEGLERVKSLVLSLRTFSRLDEGELKTIDLEQSIDSVLLVLQHRLMGRVRIEKNFGPERNLYCYGGHLNQVIMNLVSNAMDSIVGDGVITISVAFDPQSVRISIRDTGSGIPEEIRSRIFDPFFTTKPVGKGTGLGLAISYGIIQDHHGSIEVNTLVGSGSEFIVTIPRDLESRTATK